MLSGAGAQASPDPTRHVAVVEDLIGLLQARPVLRAALERAIARADLEGLRDMDSFLTSLDDLVTFIPNERELTPKVLKYYYIVNQAPEDQLNRDETFNAWMKKFAQAWGSFLDTPQSASGIGSFVTQPNYHVDDYFVGPSGWLTFNQFFAREVKPGKRVRRQPGVPRIRDGVAPEEPGGARSPPGYG